MPALTGSRPSLPFTLPRIYPITDERISGLTHAQQVEQLIDGGTTFIQLREKYRSPRTFYDEALKAVDVAKRFGVPIIINDRVDIAHALGTGVHLGQGDLPPAEARRILGPEAIIGYSTHTADQASQAADLPVNYIAVGPVFSTQTKADIEPVIGIAGLKTIRSSIGDRQIVAIGGINESNLSLVLEAGADSVAVISSVLQPPGQISVRMRRLITIANNI